MVIPQKTIPNTVETIGRKAGSHVVERPRLIKEIILDNAVLIIRPAGVQAHLQILIIDLNVVKGELNIREHT